MELRLHSDLAGFARLTGALYGADPVTHTVAITVTHQLLDGTVPVEDVRALLTVHAGASVAGAALRTHPWPLLVSGLPVPAAELAAATLAGHDPELDKVFGPRDPAEAFAVAWCAATGAATKTVMANRLFRLEELIPPARVPGQARLAGPGDQDLVARWQRAFAEEALPGQPASERKATERQSADRGMQLWTVHGTPVALARASPPACGMSRIGPVYTPAEHRGHGYGSAVTAAATRWALDAGAHHVVLFTDVANPVSNSIYPRLGYRLVHDAVQLAFVGSAG
ncbi:MAG: GNAT family N-acetyltransferase [Pseudonocardiaceae bacterium]